MSRVCRMFTHMFTHLPRSVMHIYAFLPSLSMQSTCGRMFKGHSSSSLQQWKWWCVKWSWEGSAYVFGLKKKKRINNNDNMKKWNEQWILWCRLSYWSISLFLLLFCVGTTFYWIYLAFATVWVKDPDFFFFFFQNEFFCGNFVTFSDLRK